MTSGRIQTSTIDGTYFYIDWQRTSTWNNENDCGSKIKYNIGVYCGHSYGSNSIKLYAVNINGSQVYGGGTWSNLSKGDHKLVSGEEISISHDSNSGEKSFNINFTAYAFSGHNYSASQDFTLDKIDRYAYFSEQPSIASATETSINISFKPDRKLYQAQVSIDGGSNWSGVTVVSGSWQEGGTITLTGLSANTKYTIQMRIAYSGDLWTYSNKIDAWTYNYPYATRIDSFIIGDNQHFEFYNPLNRTIQIQMWSFANKAFVSDLLSINGTSYTGKLAPDAWLYLSIPNARSSQFNLDVHYNDGTTDHKWIGDLGRTYTIRGNEAPEFSDFDFYDTDGKAPNLTRMSGVKNPSILVSGMSDATFHISTDKKMYSNYGAGLSGYTFNWFNGDSTWSNYSSDAEVTNHVYDGNSTEVSVNAQDGRGLTKKVSKSVKIVFPAHTTANLRIDRENGVGTKCFLNGSITYWNGSWNLTSSRKNTLLWIGIKVNDNVVTHYGDKLAGEIIKDSDISTNGEYTTITLKNNTLELHLNGTNSGFPVGTQYKVDFYCTTGPDSSQNNDANTYEYWYYIGTTYVKSAIVGMSRYKDSSGAYHYGINGMPNDNYALNINGGLQAGSIVVNDRMLDRAITQIGLCGDADLCVKPGLYNVGQSAGNLPTNAGGYGVLLVLTNNGDNWNYADNGSWIWQFYMNTEGKLYYRNAVNNSTFESWKTII